MRKFSSVFILFLLTNMSLFAQQTVGLFQIEADSYDGYSLFTPTSSNRTYLIDPCGRVVNEWESTTPPGMSVYLLEDGSLMRAGRIGSTVFGGGGSGGKVERRSWEDSLMWSYQYSNAEVHQHHDIEPLPNGNVLVLAWEFKTTGEAVAEGRDPSLISSNLWPDHLVELKPIGMDSAEIVWEWHTWDHLIQDFDSTKPNFGVVADHPELIDLNYVGFSGAGLSSDWMHCNGIDYNPVLDQIMISCRNFEEFWVIDHSTTLTDAAGHTGGRWGKGGDLLYRWGNPRTYQRGAGSDQKLFLQHNAVWIPQGYPGAGNILVFNNGTGRPGGNSSSVDELIAPVDSAGNYVRVPNMMYGPDTLHWSYSAPNPTSFFAQNISGAQRLPNGNTLICDGPKGRFFEVDDQKNTVWTYVNPVAVGGPVQQGNNPFGNSVFRVERYPADYAAFTNRTLAPGASIEGNPLQLPSICDSIFISNDPAFAENAPILAYPNPFSGQIHIRQENLQANEMTVWDVTGRKWGTFSLTQGETRIETQDWPKGMYFLQFNHSGEVKRILKNQ